MKNRLEVQHEAFFAHLGGTIAKYGFTVITVAGTKRQPAFAYTIGNQEKRLPELLLIGNFRPTDAHHILSMLTGKMLASRAGFEDGEKVSIGGKHPLLIYSATEEAKSKYTIQAGQFYANEDYDVQQVLLPDPNGHYSGDAACHKMFKVPVLKQAKS